MMTLIKHDVTGSCKDLVDLFIKQIHMWENQLDCVKLFGDGATKISILQVHEQQSN